MDIRNILGDHGIEDGNKATVDGDFSELTDRLNNLSQFITGAFADGIVSEVEAKKISIYINLLRESDRKMKERYEEVFNSDQLEAGPVKTELNAAKMNYDILLLTLIGDIEVAIADGIATPEESERVDSSYLNFIEGVGRLERAIEVAIQAIIGLATSIAEQNAIDYAEGIRDDIKETTDELGRKLLAAEGYIDGAFRDGVISEAEAKYILAHLDSLKFQKAELDKRYDEIINNYFLDGTPKLNLQSAKNTYNQRYQETINFIIEAIADDKATPEEAFNVRQSFVNLESALSALVVAFERAIDYLSQKRADEAERLAREYAEEYTDREVGVIDDILKDISSDNIVTQSERIVIKNDIIKIIGFILFDEDLMPTVQEIDDTYKSGEFYNIRQEAITLGLEGHPDLASLETAYTNLSNYLNGLTPKPWDTTSTENIEIDKLQWRSIWLEYYVTSGVLRGRIIKAIKDEEDRMKLRIEENSAAILLHDEKIELRVEKKVYEKEIEEVRRNVTLKVEIISSNGFFFRNGFGTTVLEARVYKGSENITDQINAALFRWTRSSDDAAGDVIWNQNNASGRKTIQISSDDVQVRATFNCDILEEI